MWFWDCKDCHHSRLMFRTAVKNCLCGLCLRAVQLKLRFRRARNVGWLIPVGLLICSSTFAVPFNYDRSVGFDNFREVLENRARRPKIGLALSGGGARGFAQIGVLQA